MDPSGRRKSIRDLLRDALEYAENKGDNVLAFLLALALQEEDRIPEDIDRPPITK
jgi:hypothetical protein